MWAVGLAIVLASPPQELGGRLAREVTEAARESGARRVRLEVRGAAELAGVPALVEIAAALESELGSRLAGPGESADIAIVAELARVRGRIALGGAVVKDGAARDWVLVSTEETPEWWAWLAPIGAPLDAGGFAWERVGSIGGEVRDADAGDLDGDGRVELAAATDDELIVFAARGATAEVIARAPLANGERAETVTRAPRTFVRIVSGAGASGEAHVRRSDEKRTRIFGWENGALVKRADREVLVLATRPGGREPVVASVAPGTNLLADVPRLRRGNSGKPLTSASGPWIDARAADLPPLDQLGTTGPAWGLLDAAGTLRLLRADLRDAGRVAKCGAAYALADFDGDGKSEALCSGDGPLDAPDRLTLGTLWSADTAGAVTAIAAGPTAEAGTAALVFIRANDSTEVWLLRRPRIP